MSTVGEALELLRNFAPVEYEFKKEYDNNGLMIGSMKSSVSKILCCLDVTYPVVEEAERIGAELIISHHPVIWNPLKSITDDTLQGKILLKAAKCGISIYSAHTNLDFCSGGINEFVATNLGLRNLKPLDAYISEDAGFGRVGDLSNKVNASALKIEVENVLKDNHVRIIGDPEAYVKRIAVINGGGGGSAEYVDMAIAAGADCLITADVKHHIAVYAKGCGLTIIEPQHYNMEHIYIARLVQILKLEAKSGKVKFEVVQAESEVNPRI